MRRTLLWLLITAVCPFWLCGCTGGYYEDGGRTVVTVGFTGTAGLVTRSSDPPEDMITDINLFVFNEDGMLEERIYKSSRAVSSSGTSCSIGLIKSLKYNIYACVNFGYELTGIGSLEELLAYRYYITYPDEYSRGLPMVAKKEDFKAGDSSSLELELLRLMSKISLRIDRSHLNSGITFNVRSVQIGNCPRSVTIGEGSVARSSSDVFNEGFIKSYSEVDGLNRDESVALSEEVSVYMLENMQGDLLDDDISDSEKLVSGGYEGVCSYIEMKVEYKDSNTTTIPGDYLIYRFYMGMGNGNFDIERNCHYHFTVRPEGTGLSEDSWRVDKTGLVTTSTGIITAVHPANYIEGLLGDQVHIWAEVDPPDAAFSIGEEELEFDKATGIYDYTIDEDGHGVTLDLTGRGTGILYFEAGNPVSDAAMVMIVVN